MLVLTRKRGERILIGDEIVVSVESVDRFGKVRIGVQAPREIAVHREEVAVHREEVAERIERGET